MSKQKTLCDWDRTDIENSITEILNLINNPKYICRKCARAAKDEKVLCKPLKIKKVKKN